MTRVKLDMDVIAQSHVNLDAIPGRTKGKAKVRGHSGITDWDKLGDQDQSNDSRVSTRVRNHWYSGE